MRLYLDIESMPREPANRSPPTDIEDELHGMLPEEAANAVLAKFYVRRRLKTRTEPPIWTTHQPIVISWAVDDQPVQHVSGLDEAQLLADFREAMLESPGSSLGKCLWVGHYVRGFDLRVLRISLLRHGYARLAALVPHGVWDKRAVCTMQLAAGADPTGRVSLEQIALALGLDGKGELGDIDWYDVWSRIEDEGVLEHVASRCDLDVDLMRHVHRKLAGLPAPEEL